MVLPPGGPLLLALIGLLALRRRPRLGGALLLTGWFALYLLSLPLVAQALAARLETAPAVSAQAARASDAGAVVVLGGGRYVDAPEYGADTLSRWPLERVRYAAHLARATGLPVLVSGGAPFGGEPEADLMAAVLQEFGVSARWLERDSRTTWENGTYSASLLAPHGIEHVLLVTSAWHMPRAQRAFERAGLTVVAAPTGYTRLRHPARRGEDFLPSAEALDISRRVLREELGALVYRFRPSPATAGAPSGSTDSPGE
ncbi:YdcF family protein [Ectothiorhodospiraceae bacterium 2226]|nr:YdcF family protein [Ectothiorhodospiraceae bacterium 2226]